MEILELKKENEFLKRQLKNIGLSLESKSIIYFRNIQDQIFLQDIELKELNDNLISVNNKDDNSILMVFPKSELIYFRKLDKIK